MKEYGLGPVERGLEQGKGEKELILEIAEKVGKFAKSQIGSEDFEKKIRELRDTTVEENPDQALLIDSLFEVRRVARIHETLNEYEKKKWTRAEKEMIKDTILELTEWNFMATELLKNADGDKEFASSFWRAYFDIYLTFSPRTKESMAHKKGIVGQVGVYNLLEGCGIKTSLASPKDDAFNKADLVCHLPSEEVQTQVKHTSRVDRPIIEATDDIMIPPHRLKQGEKEETFISAKDMEEMIGLKASCKEIARRTGRETRGLYIAMPVGSMDGDTGEIKPEFLEQLKEEIGNKLPQDREHATIDDLMEKWGK
ncbi:hypothetical protein HQ544_02245 [Candidatus Falkowbacteria bacterium]|nr:hypothetical protein [Candidatus Falkowbacteria bacterium]